MKPTMYTIEKLITEYPNDQDLGKEIRKLLWKTKNSTNTQQSDEVT